MESTGYWQDVLARPADTDHLVQLDHDQNFLAETASFYICSGLQQGEAILAAVTREQRKSLHRYASDRGCNLKAAQADGRLRFIDAESFLETLMEYGAPDRDRFFSSIGGALRELRQSNPRVRVYGEMVNLLWQREQRAAAARLEQFWNALRERQSFPLLCNYCIDCLDAAAYGNPLATVCRSHTHLVAAADGDSLRDAVAEAARAVLGPSLAKVTQELAEHSPAADGMPSGQAILFYVTEHMPFAAARILSLARVSRSPGARHA